MTDEKPVKELDFVLTDASKQKRTDDECWLTDSMVRVEPDVFSMVSLTFSARGKDFERMKILNVTIRAKDFKAEKLEEFLRKVMWASPGHGSPKLMMKMGRVTVGGYASELNIAYKSGTGDKPSVVATFMVQITSVVKNHPEELDYDNAGLICMHCWRESVSEDKTPEVRSVLKPILGGDGVGNNPPCFICRRCGGVTSLRFDYTPMEDAIEMGLDFRRDLFKEEADEPGD